MMFPVATTSNRCRGSMEHVTVPEVAILCDHDPVLGVGYLDDLGVCRAIPVRQLACVHRVMPRSLQKLCEPRRHLGVDQELHAADSGTTRPPAARAPNSKAARMSSRSRSG